LALQEIGEEARSAILLDKKAIHDFVDNLYYSQVLAQRARERGIDKREEVIAQINKFTRDLLVKEELSAAFQEAKVPDFEQAAKEHFLANSEDYRGRLRLEVSHIMVRFRAEGNEESLALLKSLKQQIENGEAEFEELVKQYSDDERTVSSGGVIGVIDERIKQKYFYDAASKLENPGEIAGPIVGDFGYHLIRLERRLQAPDIKFADVKGQIVEKLKEGYRKDFINAIYLDIRDDPNVKVDLEAIYSLSTEVPSQNDM
jgi:peptidyl-prolyl cis-trans isomerase C